MHSAVKATHYILYKKTSELSFGARYNLKLFYIKKLLKLLINTKLKHVL